MNKIERSRVQGSMNSLAREANLASLDPLEMWRSISNSWKILNKEVEKALSSTGLSLAELKILRTLNEYGPLPMTRLTHELLITPGATTSLIDELEAQGLAERVRNSDDRRVITIRITSRGEASLKKALVLHKRYVMKKFGALSKKQIIQLVELLDILSKSTA